jgi:DNA-binding XRE family transcriptional regulator
MTTTLQTPDTDPFGFTEETPSEALARQNAMADLNLIYRLRQARIHRDLTQQELADLMGTTLTAVQEFESNNNEPKLSTVRRYAHALNVVVEHKVTIR